MSKETKEENPRGAITGVNGPVVHASGMTGFRMLELVNVGDEGLVGEIIQLEEDRATIQVYEDTSGVSPGEPVKGTGAPLTVELGPGLISRVFDGIQRPLEKIRETAGDFIRRGIDIPRLDRESRWEYAPRLEEGQKVRGGEILGTVQETSLVEHRILVPPGVKGELRDLAGEGSYTVEEALGKVVGEKGETTLTMMQNWQVRRARPVESRLHPSVPLVTGQRIIDVFFPLAKGGTAAIPGGFGTGKTVIQNSLAKWCDADIIIYIGCGERGNEMTAVLTEFPELKDPRTGHSLAERTILIANTSNMPVAAREASIYTGVTLAEYYRDMGYHVAVMADSTSRWAEALREISGRLEEMPAEEGFPAYLATRLAEFYERAGRFRALSGEDGSVSIIGAVSPPGGDFSEPVTQHTKRFVRCFWALDKELAAARFFPAINPMDSYSDYPKFVKQWWNEETGEDLEELKSRAMYYLREDDRLQNIVQLIGEESLPDEQRMIVVAARLLKEGFLQQNAFDPVDTYAMPVKQLNMLRTILRLCDMGRVAVSKGIPVYRIQELDSYRELQRMKSEIPNDEPEKIDELQRSLEKEMNRVFPIEDWESEIGGRGAAEEEGRDWEAAEKLMEEHTRDELYDMAQERDIQGRSNMTKEELARELAGGTEAEESAQASDEEDE